MSRIKKKSKLRRKLKAKGGDERTKEGNEGMKEGNGRRGIKENEI